MTVASIRASLHKALNNIGKRNGHALPASKSNVEPLLHMLYVAAESKAFFNKYHEGVKKQLRVDGLLDDMPNEGESKVMAEGEVYSLVVRRNKSSRKLTEQSLRVAMLKRMSAQSVDEIIDEAKVLQSGATYIESVPK